MPMLIRDEKLEKRLESHAISQAVPTQKTALALTILRSVIDVADAEGADVSKLLGQLQRRAARLRMDAAA